jgi:AcrR family transcriptional regulator
MRLPRLNAAQLRDRQERILDAAELVFLRVGFAEASVADAARQAGVSDGLIYRYFDSKQALRDAVLVRFYRRVLQGAEAAITAETNFASRLLALIETHLSCFRDDRALCRFFISQVRVAADYPGSLLQDLNRRYTRVLLKVLRQGMAEGAMRSDADPRLVRDMLYGGMEHVAWRSVSGGATLDVALLARQILTIVLKGVMTEAM